MRQESDNKTERERERELTRERKNERERQSAESKWVRKRERLTDIKCERERRVFLTMTIFA